MTLLLVALGGAVGSVARWALGGWVQRAAGVQFPSGTLLVNVTGSLLIGVLARRLQLGADDVPVARLLLITGFCGGYTTFSTFSLDTLELLRDGQAERAFAYVTLSVLLSLGAVWAGYALGGAGRA